MVQKTLAGGKQRSLDTFFAGLIGGWCVFGERNAVNEQVSSFKERERERTLAILSRLAP